MRYVVIFILALFLGACSSLPYRDFDSIQKGMDRIEVTERVGSPLHVRNSKQPHVWIYRFYDEDKKELFREVQFEGGKVIYAGPQVTKERIINPVGSSYTQKDLEDYLKKESNLEKAKPNIKQKKELPDQADMEAEMPKDLKSQDNFTEIKPATN